MLDVLWNAKKCAKPRECAKCLNACPNGVLSMYGAGRQPGKRENNWTIAPQFLALCDGCRLCVQACPQGALNISNGS